MSGVTLNIYYVVMFVVLVVANPALEKTLSAILGQDSRTGVTILAGWIDACTEILER